jgi:hypothetical protein
MRTREREVARFPKACYGPEEKPLLRTNSTSSINADAEKCQTGGVPCNLLVRQERRRPSSPCDDVWHRPWAMAFTRLGIVPRPVAPFCALRSRIGHRVVHVLRQLPDNTALNRPGHIEAEVACWEILNPNTITLAQEERRIHPLATPLSHSTDSSRVHLLVNHPSWQGQVTGQLAVDWPFDGIATNDDPWCVVFSERPLTENG